MVEIVTDWRGLPDGLKGAAVAIGAFDGVHRGHQAVIATAREAARSLGAPLGVVTDVPGANKQGLDCLFIAQGIHGDQAKGPDGTLDPARAADLLKAETTYARYAALELAW